MKRSNWIQLGAALLGLAFVAVVLTAMMRQKLGEQSPPLGWMLALVLSLYGLVASARAFAQAQSLWSKITQGLFALVALLACLAVPYVWFEVIKSLAQKGLGAG